MIGKLITKTVDGLAVEHMVAFNSDASITIGTCAEDAVTFYPERTCTMRNISWDNGECTWGCKCMSCGEKFEHQKAEYGWRYCPSCGARVVKE